MTKIISDNYAYAKAAKLMGDRANAVNVDFSGIDTIDEDVENEIKDASVISMGTEIAATDLENIGQLADQVISLSEYRAQLSEYLKRYERHSQVAVLVVNWSARD